MVFLSARIKIVFSLICADFLLLLLVAIFPEKGMPVASADSRLVFLTWKSFSKAMLPQPKKKQGSSVALQNRKNIPIIQTIYDTSAVNSSSLPDSSTLLNGRVENPEINGKKALDNFFEALYRLKQDSAIVRIAHYGDSQIEGDRITQFLRANFQKRFGGSGLGFIPIDEPASHHSYTRRQSPNWRRHSVFKGRINNGLYGPGGTVFRFQPPLKQDGKAKYKSDSLFEAIVKEKANDEKIESWLQLTLREKLSYDSLTVLSWRHFTPLHIKLQNNDNEQYRLIPAGQKIERVTFSAREAGHSFKLHFSSSISPYIAGVFLDGKKGVQIDNYSLRGHSGNGLALVDFSLLQESLKLLNTKFIIFQYGGNIVPYDVPSFKFFEDDIVKMVERFKKACPDASILIIGVGDMARRVGDGYESYPTVEKIRDAQRRAAQRTGVAFWDLYETMGGENTITNWVNSPTPLAAPDYAHLSYLGQKKVSDWLFKALMQEYELFLQQKKREEYSIIKKPTM